MSAEVLDSNVLTIASAPGAGWVHPRIPLRERELIFKVFKWVQAFHNNRTRHLVLDGGGTIFEEYRSAGNMPRADLYGRRVVQAKWDRGEIQWVQLEYWLNGSERVAELPQEVAALIHDLGDRKMVAAAYEAGACAGQRLRQ